MTPEQKAELIQNGLYLQSMGDYEKADEIYQKILNYDHLFFDGWFLSGTVQLQTKKPLKAISYFEKALEISPHNSATLINLAIAYQTIKQPEKARTYYNQALLLDPKNVDANFNYGVFLEAIGDISGATAAYEKICLIMPNHLGATNNLGIIYQKEKEHGRAISLYLKYLNIESSNLDIHYSLANSYLAIKEYNQSIKHYLLAAQSSARHHNIELYLGIAYLKNNNIEQSILWYKKFCDLNPGRIEIRYELAFLLYKNEKYEEALDQFNQLLVMDPSSTKYLLGQADTLQQMERYEEAIISYHAVLNINPNDSEAHNNLGCALSVVMRNTDFKSHYNLINQKKLSLSNHYNNDLTSWDYYQLAITEFNTAIQINPNYIQAYNNLACTLMEMNRFLEAIIYFDKALSIAPSYFDAAWNKGLSLLCLGDFKNGLPLYENRPSTKGNLVLDQCKESLRNASIHHPKWCIVNEQGFGDMLQCLRFINSLINKGVNCSVKLPDPLIGLAQRSFPQARIIDIDSNCDGLQIPIMSLPLVLEVFDEKDIPDAPYLKADPEKLNFWGENLNFASKKIGLFWRGQRKLRNNNRSIPFQYIMDLIKKFPTYHFMIIQKELTTPEWLALSKCKNVTLCDEHIKSFDDTAAIMMQLDVMITICSSPAHLAGGLGVNTWVLLPFAADWRWMVGRTDSPWYPTATLFHQKTIDDWKGVMERVSEQLKLLY